MTFSHPDLVAFWVNFKTLVNQAKGSDFEAQVSDPRDGLPCKKTTGPGNTSGDV